MNALFSLADRKGMEEIAQRLSALGGWSFYGSKGTAGALNKNGIAATDISTMVGDPSPDHLVVTLSAIHFGILADKGNPAHMAWLAEKGLPYIDFVWIAPYNLMTAVRKNEPEAMVQKATDMGGLALLRSGAKGRRLVSPSLEITEHILRWLETGRPNEAGFRTWLAWIAEEYCSKYCLLSAEYLFDQIEANGGIPDLCPPLTGPGSFEIEL